MHPYVDILKIALLGLVPQHPVLTPEYLLPSLWVPVLAPSYSLLRRSEQVFTLYRSMTRTKPIRYVTLHF